MERDYESFFFFSLAPYPAVLRAAIISATLTSFPAVTVVSALEPVFLPTFTLETPLTFLSAACTFLGHPEAHRKPVTIRTVSLSFSATTSVWMLVVVTKGAATAPAVNAAKAAIIVIVVFISLLVTGSMNYSPDT